VTVQLGACPAQAVVKPVRAQQGPISPVANFNSGLLNRGLRRAGSPVGSDWSAEAGLT
jgi:hypothetical protein